MPLKQKLKCVIYLKQTADGDMVLLPVAVTSAKGRTFSGNDCNNCVVIPKAEWQQNGLNLLLQLARKVPFTVDEPFEGWPAHATVNYFEIEFSNAHMTSYKKQGSARLESWVEVAAGEEPQLGKTSIYPAWTPHMSQEVFNFAKPPAQDKFLNETERLLGKQ